MATVEERHPELFRPDLRIDHQSGIRTVPMEVINLRFPRTGTMCECLYTLCQSVTPLSSSHFIVTIFQTALNVLGYIRSHSTLYFSTIRECAAYYAD